MRNTSIETPRTSGGTGPATDRTPGTTDQSADGDPQQDQQLRDQEQKDREQADLQQKDPQKTATQPAVEREPGRPVTTSQSTERPAAGTSATTGRDGEQSAAAKSATTGRDGAERSEAAKSATPGRDGDERSAAAKSAGTAHGTDERAAAGSAAAHTTASSATETAPGADVAGRLGRRMDHAIGGFVDDPRRAVREADDVLDEAIKHVARLIESRRSALRSGCKDGAGTEELRVALTRYRDMTDELLAL
ncbi:hypothetical protein [Actinacidiphila paucisporea]|uniref:Uncharacterized protein n=1 Tax=Actinacidiphila paucisporea TaxID=310782 RepID=A0A1M6XMK1_9ACTN|nr:hypothetical protein [Actinacidiphila paucisporea]SHL07194.1 hypothetical protein SAMN05216499_102463 [Actinacidiphila paucisporea]